LVFSNISKKELILIKVAHIGSSFKSFDSIWGGNVATSTYLKMSFENDDDIDITFLPRSMADTVDQLRELRNEYDLIHVDHLETAQTCFLNDIPIDIIGPVLRAPDTVKQYGKKPNGDYWRSIYTEDWFYSHQLLRLNNNEERLLVKNNSDYCKNITYIDHGVPTELLSPKKDNARKIILWAGDKNRHAKNFELFLEITTLFNPEKYGFVFKELSGYRVSEYFDLLDDVAILVNTSRNETFCNAMFEAKAKGVVTLCKEALHNGVKTPHPKFKFWTDFRIQVPYTTDGYVSKLEELCSNHDLLEYESNNSLSYARERASLNRMKNSFKLSYFRAFSRKKGVISNV